MASFHVTNSLQGFRNRRNPCKDEVKLFVDNEEEVVVEWIGDVFLWN